MFLDLHFIVIRNEVIKWVVCAIAELYDLFLIKVCIYEHAYMWMYIGIHIVHVYVCI